MKEKLKKIIAGIYLAGVFGSIIPVSNALIKEDIVGKDKKGASMALAMGYTLFVAPGIGYLINPKETDYSTHHYMNL